VAGFRELPATDRLLACLLAYRDQEPHRYPFRQTRTKAKRTEQTLSSGVFGKPVSSSPSFSFPAVLAFQRLFNELFLPNEREEKSCTVRLCRDWVGQSLDFCAREHDLMIDDGDFVLKMWRTLALTKREGIIIGCLSSFIVFFFDFEISPPLLPALLGIVHKKFE
jgi:hypothetical protein